ncbi:hypothetical protein P3T23_009800 [Paraburkholderia sp. GAS448]|uniref:hypothetical protein n=1 Tax=Paraburkholderia sp. GAS448 TaxID=3035136 RepID=UPI003D1CEAAC
MYLTIEQRAALRVAAKNGIDAIDGLVSWLRTNHPTAFHDSKSLRERVFLVEPANRIPCRDVLRPALAEGRERKNSIPGL